MPLINIEYDSKIVSKKEITLLSKSIRKIVSQSTKINDVFVYTNNSEIKIETSPIEIFIRMSKDKIDNRDNLIKEIKSSLKNWKDKINFQHKINLTLIPMDWNVEIGI